MTIFYIPNLTDSLKILNEGNTLCLSAISADAELQLQKGPMAYELLFRKGDIPQQKIVSKSLSLEDLNKFLVHTIELMDKHALCIEHDFIEFFEDIFSMRMLLQVSEQIDFIKGTACPQFIKQINTLGIEKFLLSNFVLMSNHKIILKLALEKPSLLNYLAEHRLTQEEIELLHDNNLLLVTQNQLTIASLSTAEPDLESLGKRQRNVMDTSNLIEKINANITFLSRIFDKTVFIDYLSLESLKACQLYWKRKQQFIQLLIKYKIKQFPKTNFNVLKTHEKIADLILNNIDLLKYFTTTVMTTRTIELLEDINIQFLANAGLAINDLLTLHPVNLKKLTEPAIRRDLIEKHLQISTLNTLNLDDYFQERFQRLLPNTFEKPVQLEFDLEKIKTIVYAGKEPVYYNLATDGPYNEAFLASEKHQQLLEQFTQAIQQLKEWVNTERMKGDQLEVFSNNLSTNFFSTHGSLIFNELKQQFDAILLALKLPELTQNIKKYAISCLLHGLDKCSGGVSFAIHDSYLALYSNDARTILSDVRERIAREIILLAIKDSGMRMSIGNEVHYVSHVLKDQAKLGIIIAEDRFTTLGSNMPAEVRNDCNIKLRQQLTPEIVLEELVQTILRKAQAATIESIIQLLQSFGHDDLELVTQINTPSLTEIPLKHSLLRRLFSSKHFDEGARKTILDDQHNRYQIDWVTSNPTLTQIIFFDENSQEVVQQVTHIYFPRDLLFCIDDLKHINPEHLKLIYQAEAFTNMELPFETIKLLIEYCPSLTNIIHPLNFELFIESLDQQTEENFSNGLIQHIPTPYFKNLITLLSKTVIGRALISNSLALDEAWFNRLRQQDDCLDHVLKTILRNLEWEEKDWLREDLRHQLSSLDINNLDELLPVLDLFGKDDLALETVFDISDRCLLFDHTLIRRLYSSGYFAVEKKTLVSDTYQIDFIAHYPYLTQIIFFTPEKTVSTIFFPETLLFKPWVKKISAEHLNAIYSEQYLKETVLSVKKIGFLLHHGWDIKTTMNKKFYKKFILSLFQTHNKNNDNSLFHATSENYFEDFIKIIGKTQEGQSLLQHTLNAYEQHWLNNLLTRGDSAFQSLIKNNEIMPAVLKIIEKNLYTLNYIFNSQDIDTLNTIISKSSCYGFDAIRLTCLDCIKTNETLSVNDKEKLVQCIQDKRKLSSAPQSFFYLNTTLTDTTKHHEPNKGGPQ